MNSFPLLFKSMKSEYVEDTLKKGRFCFNHPAVFNRWESPNAAQYDPWDAYSAYTVTHLVFAPIIGEENGMPIYGKGKRIADKAVVHTQTDDVKRSPVCCFRMIEEQEVTLLDNSVEFSLGKIADRIINEFEHDSYIMIWAKPFLERVQQKCPNLLCGAVVYKNTLNDYDFHVSDSIEETVEQLFRKNEQYSWQKEYRIVLPPTKDSPVFVELGSIEDIAVGGKIFDLKN